MKIDVKNVLLPNLPYVFVFWFFNRVAEGYRLAEGADMVTKAMGAVSGLGALVSKNPIPSFHPRDLLLGAVGAVIIRAVVYFKAKNAKKYRHGVEYGSARWFAMQLKEYQRRSNSLRAPRNCIHCLVNSSTSFSNSSSFFSCSSVWMTSRQTLPAANWLEF